MSIDRCIASPVDAAYQSKLNGFFLKLSDSLSDIFYFFVSVDNFVHGRWNLFLLDQPYSY